MARYQGMRRLAAAESASNVQTSHNRATGRRRATNSSQPTQLRFLSILVVLISLLSVVSAQEFDLEASAYNTPLLKRLARRGEIHFDRRDPPPLPRAIVKQRQDNKDSSSPTSTADASSPTTSSTNTNIVVPVSSSSAPSSAQPAVSITPTVTETVPSGTLAPSALPSPFDTSLGNNFTSASCPNFFASFLQNSTFQSCVPVSLLLQNSNSFFLAVRSATLLAETLNTACAASLPQCQSLMTSLATQLTESSNCGADYADQNPLVAQAHAGLVAYEPVYRATCLKSNETGNYCFADAITNQFNPSDAYPYYTAVGLNLLTTSRPTCTSCLRETMAIYAEYALEESQPLAATYTNCANTVDSGCGAAFANVSVPVGTLSTSGAAGRSRGGVVWNLVVAVVAVAATGMLL